MCVYVHTATQHRCTRYTWSWTSIVTHKESQHLVQVEDVPKRRLASSVHLCCTVSLGFRVVHTRGGALAALVLGAVDVVHWFVVDVLHWCVVESKPCLQQLQQRLVMRHGMLDLLVLTLQAGMCSLGLIVCVCC